MNAVRVTDFTKIPGPRYRHQGPDSGQQFREEYLEPAFLKARKAGEQLLVVLGGVEFGYPVSFLEESFGGLARDHGIQQVRDTLVFDTGSQPMLERRIQRYIDEAEQKKPAAHA